jgi:hypothetical protein
MSDGGTGFHSNSPPVNSFLMAISRDTIVDVPCGVAGTH